MDAPKHFRKRFKYVWKVLKNVRKSLKHDSMGLKLFRNGPEQRGRVSDWTTRIQSSQKEL